MKFNNKNMKLRLLISLLKAVQNRGVLFEKLLLNSDSFGG